MTNSEAAIEMGKALYRLSKDEDFAYLRTEWDERIKDIDDQLRGWDEADANSAAKLSRLAHRRNALVDLREWIDETIQLGIREKIKADARSQKVSA